MHWSLFDTVDLEDERRRDDKLYRQLMLPGDNQGHVWSVSVLSGGEPVDITGQTVQAFFIRADGNTVVVTGAAHGNAAVVTLPREAYYVRGALRAIMRLGDSVESTSVPVTTIAERRFYVSDGVGDSLISPSNSFPTLSGLAEDMQELEGTVTTQGAAISQITEQITSQDWQDLGAASGVSAGTANMGTKTGYVCAYRVENGNHVIAAANVAVSFTNTTPPTPKVLNSIVIPADLQPSSRIVRIAPIDGGEYYCRAYVEHKAAGTNAGMIALEWVGRFGYDPLTSKSILWTDIIIDWYVDDN